MEDCFASRTSPLSYEDAVAVQRCVHRSHDLANKGLGHVGKVIDGLRVLLPWKAEYFLSYRCQKCMLHIVDYGRVLGSAEAKTIARDIAAKTQSREGTL
jgi:hypothetical protein